MHETRLGTSQSIRPSDMHTIGIHHVCNDIKRCVNYGRLFQLTQKVRGHYQ